MLMPTSFSSRLTRTQFNAIYIKSFRDLANDLLSHFPFSLSPKYRRRQKGWTESSAISDRSRTKRQREETQTKWCIRRVVVHMMMNVCGLMTASHYDCMIKIVFLRFKWQTKKKDFFSCLLARTWKFLRRLIKDVVKLEVVCFSYYLLAYL